MSYNITRFKLKKLENFIIPVPCLFASSQKRHWPVRVKCSSEEDAFAFGDVCAIRGKVLNDYLLVSHIDICGEGSGDILNNVLDVAFKESTGLLEAALVWEGGEYISRITVSGGTITEKEVEL